MPNFPAKSNSLRPRFLTDGDIQTTLMDHQTKSGSIRQPMSIGSYGLMVLICHLHTVNYILVRRGFVEPIDRVNDLSGASTGDLN